MPEYAPEPLPWLPGIGSLMLYMYYTLTACRFPSLPVLPCSSQALLPYWHRHNWHTNGAPSHSQPWPRQRVSCNIARQCVTCWYGSLL